MKKEIFIVRAGSGTVDRTDIFLSSKVEFAATNDHEVVREFIFKGLYEHERPYLERKVQDFLDGKRKYVHVLSEGKALVRCEVQKNAMLQVYEIIKTIEEGK